MRKNPRVPRPKPMPRDWRTIPLEEIRQRFERGEQIPPEMAQELREMLVELRGNLDRWNAQVAEIARNIVVSQARKSGRVYGEMYSETHNPLFAWEAYYRCRQTRQPVPEWVLRYFDEIAQKFSALCSAAERSKRPHRRKSKRPHRRKRKIDLGAVLGMRNPGKTGKSGRGTAFAQHRNQLRDLFFAEAVQREMHQSDIGPEKASAVVAREKGVSTSTVSRAWRRYGSALGRI